MIKDDNPQPAPPVTPEERKAILDKLGKYFSLDRLLTLDGEQRRGSRSNRNKIVIPFRKR